MESQRKGCLSRSMAFPKGDDMRMVKNLRMQAVRATFLSLPRERRWAYSLQTTGL
jgi:hypothetical protein